MATTTLGYQPVVVVPTVVPVSRNAMDWRRRGVQVGGLALGLPCVICLAAFGFIFLLSGISALSINTGFDDDVFDDDFFDKHDDNNPIMVMGIVMLVVGGLLIVAAMVVCYAGHRAYTKFAAGSSGRVINTNPNVPAVGVYPVAASSGGYAAGQVGGQMGSYPAPGQPVMYPAPPPGQYPVPYQGQPGPYPPPVSGHPGPYPPPASGHPGPYPPPAEGQYQPQLAAGVYAPPTKGPYGAPGPYSNEQYPDVAPQASGLPQKAGLPGEVAPTAPNEPYDRPPQYSP